MINVTQMLTSVSMTSIRTNRQSHSDEYRNLCQRKSDADMRQHDEAHPPKPISNQI